MHPIINLQQQFQKDLDRWLAHRSLLNLKIISISIAEIRRERSPYDKAEIDPVSQGSVFLGVSLSGWLGQSRLCYEVNIEYEYYSPMEL